MAEKLFVIFLEMGVAGSVAGGLFLFLRERFHRRYMARTLCMVWLALALWLVLPLQSLLPAPIQIELPPASVEQTASVQNGSAEPEATQVTKTVEVPGAASQGQTARDSELPLPALSTLLSLLTIVWLAGVVLYGAGQIAAYRQFLSALKAGVLSDPAELQSLFETQLERLGIRRPVALRVSREADCPMLTGLLRPTLWIPPGCLESDWNMILQHELIHYLHGDLYWRWLWAAAHTLHWYNPLVRRMERAAQDESELACDSAVVRGLSNLERCAYGEVLLRSVSSQVHWNRMASCMAGDKETMMKRMKNLFDTNSKKRGIGMCLAAALILGTSGVALHVQAVDLTPQTVSGIVEDALMSTLVLQAEDGHTYEFDKSGAEITAGEDGLRVGETVTITYTGTLDASRVFQRVTVLSVTGQDSALSVTGTVEDVLMSTLVVQSEDGSLYEFDKSSAQVQSNGTGIHIGDTVTVTYTGTSEKELTAQSINILPDSGQEPA